jgi:hypothetical protein
VKQLDLFGPRPTLREQWADDAKLKLNPTVAPEDAPRLSAALRRLLDLMKDGDWHSRSEICRVGGSRAPGRLWDLEQANHPYESRPKVKGGGEWEYRLIANPTNHVSS